MRYALILLGFSILIADGNRDPSFEFNFFDSDIYVGEDSVGAFNGMIYNISTSQINLAIVRRINELPNNWTSSICVGTICYNESIDSVSVSLNPGDSTACGILAWISGTGAGTVQLDFFELNSEDHLIVDVNFYAEMATLEDDNLTFGDMFLHPAFPNPFNPTTTIRYAIPGSAVVNVFIYDIQGRLVDALIESEMLTGWQMVQWDASQYSSGVYFVELVADEKRQIQKINLLK
tara:strand:+ start:262 stop:963 length:702 start_codon:yes stop_codon:yes gene_type:complete